ncbi:MAG: hypothetical protein AAFV53_37885 [Myxococcota bacterium]
MNVCTDILNRLFAYGLKNAPKIDRPTLLNEWVTAFKDVRPLELKSAINAHLQDGENAMWWPPIPLIRQHVDAARALIPAERRVSAKGCDACGHSGWRHAIQHRHPIDINAMGRLGNNIDEIVHRRVRCDCPRAVEAGRPRPNSDTPPDYLAILDRCARPRGRVPATLFITGTRHRLDERDADPRSPFYDQPSPEERFGPTEEAARLRWAADQAHQHGPIWAAQHIARLSGGRVRIPVQSRPDPTPSPAQESHHGSHPDQAHF